MGKRLRFPPPRSSRKREKRGKETHPVKFEKWNIGSPKQQDVELLRAAGYSYLLSTVLAARGITTPEAAAEFLESEQKLQFSPLLMRDMDRAVERIRRAIVDGEIVAVFGDYDVDGITSTVLLMDYLTRSGVTCLRYIPRRIEDGYGLSCEAIRGLHEKGATLMITVDCGITGNEEVDYANSLGMDVVVTDHHECKDDLPRAAAVVDPHRPDCPYPFKQLAGVGVALKLVLALGGSNNEERLFARYSTLAAIGTVADVMLMESENRTIVRCGLEALPHTDFVGVHALLKEAGLLGKPITSIQIGFVLSPRINAAGRMGAADLAADLLAEEDPARAEEMAKKLCDLNRERQSVEQTICTDAIRQISALPEEARSALVLASEDWHQGVVGIVASRLSEKYSCPSFMIHLKDGCGKGSCRSYGGFNLFAALEACSDLLEGFGGHELAAGFTIKEENIDPFRVRMNKYVRTSMDGALPVSSLEVDAPITCPADVTLAEIEQLSMLEPYGAGNPRPVFALQGATVDSVQPVGQGRHLKLRISKGTCRFDAIFFSATEEECGVTQGSRVDAAFYLQVNTFRGNTTLQLQLIDLRPSLMPSRHEAEALALIHRCRNGEPLSAQERSRLQTSREQFGAYWVVLQRHLRAGKIECAELPLLRELAAEAGGNESFLRAILSIAVFTERGLMATNVEQDRLIMHLLPVQEKVDLFSCPYLVRLRDAFGGRS
jgi:single-stranded-DNA-specific exonuclease